jgi:protein-S-isoprenylcysteine O-methyltransferase Ste14
MKKRLKTNAIIIFLAVVTLAAFPWVFMRHDRAGAWDEIIEVFGITSILLGQLLRVSARGYKAEHSRQGHALIQGGPYAFVRNPMYLGIVLIEMGIALMLFKWWVTLILLTVFIARYVKLIVKEERMLGELFPQAYSHYCRRTPRLLPSLSSFVKMGIRTFLPLKIRWMRKEIWPIVIVLFCTLFVESWVDISHEGIKAYMKEALAMAFVLIGFIVFILNIGIMIFSV